VGDTAHPDEPRTRRQREKFLVFGAPDIGASEIEEVLACLRSGWLGTGPRVAQFEEEFRRYKRAAHAVAVNSCTAALHLSLLAAHIGPGDEVITSPLTFCATVNAIVHAGATPVLADIDPRTMNLDPAAVAACITPRTRAVIPVHFAGRPCAMRELCALAARQRLIIVEDCAHAVEAEYHGQPTGTFGEFGCFSFYVTKNVTTGEGGMVLTKQAQDAARVKTLALHGMSKDAWKRFSDEGYKHYYVTEAGFKYNMMDLQAAIGLRQLRRVDQAWTRRCAIWERYQDALQGLPLTLPAPPEPGTRHAHHLFTILIDPDVCGAQRDHFLEAMTRQQIGVGVHYLSIPEHPYYRNAFGWRAEDYPGAMRIGRQTVSLPLSPGLSDEDVDDVIAAVPVALRLAQRRRRAA
jgi:dTDP-4-amino-4,6-dideoxygalactose transaminase